MLQRDVQEGRQGSSRLLLVQAGCGPVGAVPCALTLCSAASAGSAPTAPSIAMPVSKQGPGSGFFCRRIPPRARGQAVSQSARSHVGLLLLRQEDQVCPSWQVKPSCTKPKKKRAAGKGFVACFCGARASRAMDAHAAMRAEYAEGVCIPAAEVTGTLGKLKRKQRTPAPPPALLLAHPVAWRGAPAARFHCLSCSRNLTMETRIRCAECLPVHGDGRGRPARPTSPREDGRQSATDAHVDLCLSCFCAGKEPQSHSKHHKYQVMWQRHARDTG